MSGCSKTKKLLVVIHYTSNHKFSGLFVSSLRAFKTNKLHESEDWVDIIQNIFFDIEVIETAWSRCLSIRYNVGPSSLPLTHIHLSAGGVGGGGVLAEPPIREWQAPIDM